MCEMHIQLEDGKLNMCGDEKGKVLLQMSNLAKVPFLLFL